MKTHKHIFHKAKDYPRSIPLVLWPADRCGGDNEGRDCLCQIVGSGYHKQLNKLYIEIRTTDDFNIYPVWPDNILPFNSCGAELLKLLQKQGVKKCYIPRAQFVI